MLPTEWPEQLQQALYNQFGNVQGVEPLGGLSRNEVWRVMFVAAPPVVVKASLNSAETTFYRSYRQTLQAQAVHSPELLASLSINNTFWLVIENIPTVLPPERWLADSELIGMLRKLHQAEIDLGQDRFRPKWDDAMTNAVLSYFADEKVGRIRPILTHRQAVAQQLFTQTTPVSGDPNPNNWGIRADDTLVLFDWERFCLGAPAIDLAITVPGLGKPEDFAQVASLYLDATASADAIAWLSDDMLAAKTWTIVELLSNARAADVNYRQLLTQLVTDFQDWLT